MDMTITMIPYHPNDTYHNGINKRISYCMDIIMIGTIVIVMVMCIEIIGIGIAVIGVIVVYVEIVVIGIIVISCHAFAYIIV